MADRLTDRAIRQYRKDEIKKAEEEHFDLKEAGRVEPRPGAKGKEVQRVGITMEEMNKGKGKEECTEERLVGYMMEGKNKAKDKEEEAGVVRHRSPPATSSTASRRG